MRPALPLLALLLAAACAPEPSYEGGRLDIVLEGEEDFPQIETEGQAVEEAFAPADARRFVEAFERVKAGR